MEIIVGLIIGSIILFIWLIPLIAIAASNRTHGGEKLAWLLLVLFVSWFAWIFYLFLAPLNEASRRSY